VINWVVVACSAAIAVAAAELPEAWMRAGAAILLLNIAVVATAREYTTRSPR